jgi:hypothetical protein
MKEFLGFITWSWNNQQRWQKLWIVAMFFMGMGLSAEGWAKPIILSVPVCIFGFYLTKWMVWDVIQDSWAKYKQHRNSLLTTIKASDER